jgi:hypothetical protein
MKSLKEKQLLVKWSKAMNEPVDQSLLEEVERYEQLQKQIIESVRQNTINDLTEASKVAENLVIKISEFPKPPTLEQVLEVLKEETNELVQSQTEQVIEDISTTVIKSPTKTLAQRASDHITKEVKLEEKADSFQQPDPLLVEKNISAITKKLKFLEQAIGKIAAHGPGSGETRFFNLDDVARDSIGDTHKILRFRPSNVNPAFSDFYFDFLSGDQGQINSLKYDPYVGYTSNANVAAGLTYYDPQRDTLEILHKDATRTYVGLDNYIRYKNGTSNTITRGSLVQFIGSDLIDTVPLGGLFTANVNSVPLYIIGVSATECTPNNITRAMLLGELEDFNASGNISNEIWNSGDVLWSSPSSPGHLTNIRPSAPNVVVSVAAVMDNSATSGRILVRPTIWPRLRSGDFFSTQQQIASNTNFAFQIILDNTLFSSGIKVSNNVVTVTETGLYKFELRAQLSSTSANQKSIVVWYKKNNTNVPLSSVRQSVASNGGYATVLNNQLISLTPTDNVTVHYAVTDTTLFFDSAPILDDSANIPSVQLTVTEPSL